MSSPSPVDPVRRTCGYCNTMLPSRNCLFRHLRYCSNAKKGIIVNHNASLGRHLGNVSSDKVKETHPHDGTKEKKDVRDEDIPVKEAPTVDLKEDSLYSSYTYLRFNIRASPTGEDIQVCGDPGTGTTIIGRTLLNTLEHTVTPRQRTLKGIGKKKVRVFEWARFAFYCKGENEKCEPVIYKFIKEGWVVEDHLEPKLLIGNDFLLPHEATIRYADRSIIFTKLDNFRIEFEAQCRSHECVRRVVSRKDVTLQEGESAYLHVDYKPLPTDRNFCFWATNSNAMHTVVSAKTPHVVPIKNTSRRAVTVRRGTKLGSIGENKDAGFFSTSWKGAVKTLALAAATMGTMFGELLTPDMPTAVEPLGNVALNAEFSMTPVTNAVATETVPPREAWTMEEMAEVATNHPEVFTTNTPVTDAVYSIIQNTPDRSPTEMDPDIPVPQEPPKPKVSMYSTLGIKKPTDLPERITEEGVHVYSEVSSLADEFCDIISAYDIWTDKGIIHVPEDQQMKVPLVEGWQNTKLNSRSYPLSRRDMDLLNKTYDALHEKGRMVWVDEPTPFAHPLFVVWRRVHGEDKGRVVVDLRSLNKVAIPDSYPLPLQANVIGALKGKKFITVVDATGFFHQFGVHPSYRDRFTVVSPRGLERSTVALMGFRNSPAYVQRYMDRLLRDHDHYCKAFIDDIVIYSDTAEEHKQHLHAIFGLFQHKSISMAPKKSFVGYPSVELLGFRVDALGLTSTEERLAAFRNLAFPGQLKALEQYLGASGFLRKLIPYYAKMAEPLQKRKTALLAEGRQLGKVITGNPGKRKAYCQSRYYEPTEAELASFKAIQDAICKETTLYHHDPKRTLFIQLDGAVERGFGVMVFHLQGDNWRPGDEVPSTAVQPVMYLSKCLSNAETRYGPSELEVACLVWASKKLRTMIGSSDQVVVLTDHYSTKGIVDQTSLDTSATDRANIRLVNSSVYLSQYGLHVYHVPGRLNLVPDALSRLKTVTDVTEANGKLRRDDDPATLDTVWHTTEVVMEEDMATRFKKAYNKDPKYAAIISSIRTDNEDVENFSKPGYPFELRNGLIYNTYDGVRRLCVPHGMIKEMMTIAHDDKHHFGVQRMLQELEPYQIYRKTYLVKQYIKYCHACCLNRTDRQLPVGSMQPIRPEAEQALPMRTIAIDFILALPTVKSEGTPWQLSGNKSYYSEYNQLMTASCPVSKRTLLIPGNEKYTAEEWGMVLARQLLLSDWGIPKGIISDRDRKFTSEFWRGIWKALGTRLLMTTAYHPQADGLSERKNQTVEIALRYYYFAHPEACWLDIIPSLQWNLNAAYSEAIQSTPHELLFGFKLPGALEVLTDTDTERFQNMRFFREHLRKDAQLAMDFAAARNKRYYDARHRYLEFAPGDKVYLRLHSGYQLPGKPSRKYSQQRSGPWIVKRRVGSLAYELDFPDDYRIHPVISVEHLRPTPDGEDPFQRDTPPPGPVEMDEDLGGEGDTYEVDVVLKHRVNRRKNGFDYLIKWKGWGHEYNTWMTELQLKDSSELVQEYWDRNGPRPSVGTEAQAGAKKRGRPRKT